MSKLFRQMAAQLRADNKQYTPVLQRIELPPAATTIKGATATDGDKLLAIWRSNRFLVQLFDQAGHQRLTVCRAAMDETTGRWLDGITWDELQGIKSAIGMGDRYAVEIYPADRDLVNVSNMRHLWLVDPPAFAWRKRHV